MMSLSKEKTTIPTGLLCQIKIFIGNKKSSTVKVSLDFNQKLDQLVWIDQKRLLWHWRLCKMKIA
jgi:hypothetical protein